VSWICNLYSPHRLVLRRVQPPPPPIQPGDVRGFDGYDRVAHVLRAELPAVCKLTRAQQQPRETLAVAVVQGCIIEKRRLKPGFHVMGATGFSRDGCSC
jgi:hypothetical protein